MDAQWPVPTPSRLCTFALMRQQHLVFSATRAPPTELALWQHHRSRWQSTSEHVFVPAPFIDKTV